MDHQAKVIKVRGIRTGPEQKEGLYAVLWGLGRGGGGTKIPEVPLLGMN